MTSEHEITSETPHGNVVPGVSLIEVFESQTKSFGVSLTLSDDKGNATRRNIPWGDVEILGIVFRDLEEKHFQSVQS